MQGGKRNRGPKNRYGTRKESVEAGRISTQERWERNRAKRGGLCGKVDQYTAINSLPLTDFAVTELLDERIDRIQP